MKLSGNSVKNLFGNSSPIKEMLPRSSMKIMMSWVNFKRQQVILTYILHIILSTKHLPVTLTSQMLIYAKLDSVEGNEPFLEL